MNALRAVLLGCSFLLVASPAAPQGKEEEFATSFCPECWKFLRSKDAADKDGVCFRCGKEAIAVDAHDLTWYWCPDHEFWHRLPCAEGRYRKGWRIRTALALVVSPDDERLQKAAYCPECRLFPDPMKMERGICPSCSGKLVAVQTIEPKWFWCESRLHWKEEPCLQNKENHCCTARTGTVLSYQRYAKAPADEVSSGAILR